MGRTSAVTVGDDECTRLADERVGAPDSFVEEGGQTLRKVLGAVTRHDLRGVCDVVLLVVACDVLAIPARGEHHLEANTIGAVGVEVCLVGEKVAE